MFFDLAAFADELSSSFTKEAVDVQQLYQNVMKAPHVHTAPDPKDILGSVREAFGAGPTAQTMPAYPQMRAVVEHRFAPLGRGIQQGRDLLGKLPTWAQPSAAHDLLGHLDTQVSAARAAPAEMRKHSPEMAGRIDLRSKKIDQLVSGAGALSAPTPLQSRANMAAVGAHELYERGVKARHVAPIASHLSPEVLLKEHNLLSRLTGHGADYTREGMRTMRNTTGEAEHMRNLLNNAFGERATQFLNEGEKVPKAMRHALRRKLTENPGMVAEAAPGFWSKARRAPALVSMMKRTGMM